MHRSALALSLLALPALAITDGWDLEDEFMARAWRSDSLSWAAGIHPDEPTQAYVYNNVVPPPQEMWCDPNNWEENCDAWNMAMEQWLHHYLNIPYSQSLPTGLPAFPQECSSTCSTW